MLQEFGSPEVINENVVISSSYGRFSFIRFTCAQDGDQKSLHVINSIVKKVQASSPTMNYLYFW